MSRPEAHAPRRRIGQGAALAGIAALAILCVGSGANRMALADPLAPPRMAWLGHAAAQATTIRMIADDQGAEAVDAATALVRAAPLDRPALSLLGTARLARGDAVAADAAFRVAGRLGWRDPMTQIYWLTVALAAPDVGVATQRADGLLRTGDQPAGWAALAQLEAAPAARPLLARRLALAPEWLGTYVERLGALDAGAARRRVNLLLAARAAGLKLDRATAATGASRLVDATQPALAGILWSAFAGPGDTRAAGLWDRSFAAMQNGTVKAPFEWHPITAAPVELATGTAPDAPDETALHARAFGNLAEPVAWQMLLLAPGRYVAQWRAGGGEALDLTVECAGGAPLAGATTALAGGGRRLAFTIPATCPAQFVRVVDRPPPTPHDAGWMTPPRIVPVT